MSLVIWIRAVGAAFDSRFGGGLRKRRPSLFVGVAALVSTALCAWLIWAQPLLAAVEFNYFNVISSPAGVVLEWSTASETNASGFDVLCKRSDEPEAAFHSIGYVPAKGTLGTGALYNFPVTALQPGVPYCFRLVELTKDGSPGDVQDRCGYGISMTPTPGAPGFGPNFVPGATPAVTPTPGAVPTFDPFAQPTFDPFAQPTPTVDPFAQPTFDPFAQPTPTFDPFAQPTFDPFAQPTPTFDPFATATVDPFAAQTATATANPSGYPGPTATFVPTYTPVGYVAPQSNSPDGNSLASAAEPTATVVPPVLAVAPPPPNAESAVAVATDSPQARADAVAAAPTPAFIIATASPTRAAVVLGPGMTPLPTVTATPGLTQLVKMLEPTSQNLMVMLLCMTFTGASGLGILGLITSVMFMRSRSSQREFYDRHSNRRRL